jgi:hypothetical protein
LAFQHERDALVIGAQEEAEHLCERLVCSYSADALRLA